MKYFKSLVKKHNINLDDDVCDIYWDMEFYWQVEDLINNNWSRLQREVLQYIKNSKDYLRFILKTNKEADLKYILELLIYEILDQWYDNFKAIKSSNYNNMVRCAKEVGLTEEEAIREADQFNSNL